MPVTGNQETRKAYCHAKDGSMISLDGRTGGGRDGGPGIFVRHAHGTMESIDSINRNDADYPFDEVIDDA